MLRNVQGRGASRDAEHRRCLGDSGLGHSEIAPRQDGLAELRRDPEPPSRDPAESEGSTVEAGPAAVFHVVQLLKVWPAKHCERHVLESTANCQSQHGATLSSPTPSLDLLVDVVQARDFRQLQELQSLLAFLLADGPLECISRWGWRLLRCHPRVTPSGTTCLHLGRWTFLNLADPCSFHGLLGELGTAWLQVALGISLGLQLLHLGLHLLYLGPQRCRPGLQISRSSLQLPMGISGGYQLCFLRLAPVLQLPASILCLCQLRLHAGCLSFHLTLELTCSPLQGDLHVRNSCLQLGVGICRPGQLCFLRLAPLIQCPASLLPVLLNAGVVCKLGLHAG
mmetsp:Transcript_79554/g.140408  ORF Transcript_79554/g.140408 Transcript_79554/m.140408 type:complete len:339 (-) Transcript_79554:892-1908(-)